MPIMNTEQKIEFDNAFEINLLDATIYKRFTSFVIDAMMFMGLMVLSLLVILSSSMFYISNMEKINDVSTPMTEKMMVDFLNGSLIYGVAAAVLIPFLMGTFRKGRTIGRQYNGLAIVSKGGKAVPFWRLIIRLIAKIVTVYIGLGIGLIFMLLNKEHRAFHDLVSGTKVVEVEQPDLMEVIAVNDPENYDPKTGKLMEEKLAS
jgi:uncharacterized RDD family membrane protein YckC